MKIISAILFLIMFISLFNSCEENLIPPDINPVKISIESITPNRPLKIGEKFNLVIKIENLDSASLSSNLFINNQFHYDNNINGDTIFSYVPYIPSTLDKWIIKANAYTFNGNYFTEYDVEDTLDVIIENCLPDICVKWSDLSRVNEIDSYGYPGIYNEPAKWIAEENNDTITLSQTTRNSDDKHKILELKLLDKGAVLVQRKQEFRID
ncbi:MAG: hypothetical protein E2O46_00540 [Ignavibacteria bacterium]|nr:MAG: hypothetical protein E2O46_00540 [Ignavibacteria bacterium]